MTGAAWLFLAAAAVFAATDWLAVADRLDRLEYVAKPAAMLALVAVALTLSPHLEARRWAFVVALVFSLAGDVFLMLPSDRFVAGLTSFFIAHVAYIVGLRIGASELRPLVVSAIPVAVVAAILGGRIIGSLRERHPNLVGPVAAYVGVIAVMVASALATGEPYAALGALLFMASDSLNAWRRFVVPLGWAPVAVMVTYHLGQGLLVVSLAL